MQFDANQGPMALLAISHKSCSGRPSPISVALEFPPPQVDDDDDDNNVKAKYPPIQCWLVADRFLCNAVYKCQIFIFKSYISVWLFRAQGYLQATYPLALKHYHQGFLVAEIL